MFFDRLPILLLAHVMNIHFKLCSKVVVIKSYSILICFSGWVVMLSEIWWASGLILMGVSQCMSIDNLANRKWCIFFFYLPKSMAYCKTVFSPLLMHWRYHSLAQRHWYISWYVELVMLHTLVLINPLWPWYAYKVSWILSTLVQVMAWCPMAPSHFLIMNRLIVHWTIRNKLLWNLNQNTNIFLKEMTLKMSSAKGQPFCSGLNM